MEDGKRICRILLNILIPSAGIVLVCVLGPWLLRFFLPFVIGWLIAMIANPLVRLLERRLRLVRRHSSVLIVVVVLAGVIGVLYLVISRLIREAYLLVRDLPAIYESVMEQLQEASRGMSHILERLPQGAQDWAAEFTENLGTIAGNLAQEAAFPTVTAAGNVARGIPAALVYSIVVILSSYFFIVERDRMVALAGKVIPEGVRSYFRYFRQDLRRLIGGYFLAQFRIMFVVALILAVGFVVLGVKWGLLLAVLIAILDFLPLFGTGTALFPWALVKALSGEWAFAAGLILLYILTQVVRQIIQPKIVGDTMGLPPLSTLFLLYLGFKLHGISGMILAVPAGLVVVNLYQYGAFDSLIRNVKLLIQEVNRFRKEE